MCVAVCPCVCACRGMRSALSVVPDGFRPVPAAGPAEGEAGAAREAAAARCGTGAKRGRSAAVGILCSHRFPAAAERAGGGSALRCQPQQNGAGRAGLSFPGSLRCPQARGSSEAFCWRSAPLRRSVYRCFPVFVRVGGYTAGCCWLWVGVVPPL